MTSPLRILDANANRAREALRVMEDGARFLLNDPSLSRDLKSLRHDLAHALSAHTHAMLLERDTPNDVGTTISTPGEARRSSARDAVIAGAKRLTEALRSIEEFGKTIDPALATAIEALRYRAYDLERRLVLAHPTTRAHQPRLCVLITASLCAHHPWSDVAQRALEGGADTLQLREKHLDDAELVARTQRLLALAEPFGASIVVNDRLDVALVAGAHGVHLGQTDLPLREARALAGDRLLIGRSTSTLDEALEAQRHGADLIGVGPMYPSSTKQKPAIAGPEAIRRVARHDPPLPPHLAIGGITPENAHLVVEAGAKGLAVSSSVCAAHDPLEVARKLVDILEHAAITG